MHWSHQDKINNTARLEAAGSTQMSSGGTSSASEKGRWGHKRKTKKHTTLPGRDPAAAPGTAQDQIKRT